MSLRPLVLGRRTAAAGLLAAAALPRAGLAATPLKVAYIPILAMGQLFVMVAEGWAAAAGLDLELTRFSSGPAMVQALASGGYDAAYIGIGPAMVSRANGLDLKVVAANGINQVSLLGLGPLAEDFAAAPGPAAAFAAFRQKQGRPVRVATLPKGSVPDTVLQYWLTEVAHVAPGDVQVLGVGEDRVQQVLLSGAADAASGIEPGLTIVLERVPAARILVGGGTMFPDQPGAVLAVREATILGKRAAVQSLVALHVRATRLIAEHPAQAAKDTASVLGGGLVPEATLAKAFAGQALHPVADPHAIMAATAKLAAVQMRQGSLAKAVPVDELFDTSFFDALPPG